MIEEDKYIKIAFKKAKIVLALSISILSLTVCILYIIELSKGKYIETNLAIYNTCVCLLLFLSSVSVSLFNILIDDRRGLTITQDGILYRFNKKRTFFVRWRDIVGIKEENKFNQTFIVLTIKNEQTQCISNSVTTVESVEIISSKLIYSHEMLKLYLENQIIKNQDIID